MTFRVDAYPTQTFRGTVSQVRLEPKTDQNVVSYTTMIDVPNEDLKLKPGMTANVTVQIAMQPRCPPRAERQPAVLAGAGAVRGAWTGSSRRRGDSRRTADDSGGNWNRRRHGKRGRFAQLTPEQRAQFRAQREARRRCGQAAARRAADSDACG